MEVPGTNNTLQKMLFGLMILGGLGFVALGLAPSLFGIGAKGGFGPNQMAVAAGGLALLVSGAISILPRSMHAILEWFLLIFAVFTAAFAADLIVIRGLASLVPKIIMMGAVLFGLVITSRGRGNSGQGSLQATWREVISPDKSLVLNMASFASLVVQLLLLFAAIQQFKLENQAFYNNLIPLVFYGFLINYFMSARLRLPLFLGISISALLGILGVQNGIWLVVIGLALVGITRLPLPYYLRIGLLLSAGGLLAVMRFGGLPVPWSQAIWPVLGSIFMFRLIIYIVELKHARETGNLSLNLSYFFLLPNVVFPLFPVVDFATFRKSYYDTDAHRIYQSGIKWMLWGTIHLIVYRAVNYYLVLPPENVANGYQLYQYLVTNLMLLVRVSGQFHLIIGILHLFGFNLPGTMNEYFMASSFTDLWRRANIYWKDFMLKVFYYPLYYRLRSIPETARLIVVTLFVFAVTWFLHAYQWFWLRGTFLLTAPDMLFWAVFGVLVLINILIETKYGRKRTLGKKPFSFRILVSQSLKTTGVFIGLAIFWSLWTSSSISSWVSLWAVAWSDFSSLASLVLLLAGTVVVFGIIIGVRHLISVIPSRDKSQSFLRAALGNAVFISVVFLAGNPFVLNQTGGEIKGFITDLTTARLSSRDAQLLVKGYYEDLVGVDRFNTDLWDIYTRRPTEWPAIQETAAGRSTDDFGIVELVPSTTIDFHGSELSINRWGMRDQDYEKIPGENVKRIALFGPSFVMGSGVANQETFEARLEQRLNKTNQGNQAGKYEILNFAVAGHSALQELWIFENQAIAFQPGTTFYVSHQLEEEILVRNLADRMIRGATLPYDDLKEVMNRAGVQVGMSQEEAERLLQPFSQDLLRWTYQRFVQVSRKNDILPVWIFMPTFEVGNDPEVIEQLSGEARDAGFIVLSLENVFAGQDPGLLTVAQWDLHPNAKGHQLVAEGLFEELSSSPELAAALGIIQ